MLLGLALIYLNPGAAAFVISGPNRPAVATLLFVSTVTLMHAALAVGLWRFSRWSYYVLKGYLVVLRVSCLPSRHGPGAQRTQRASATERVSRFGSRRDAVAP